MTIKDLIQHYYDDEKIYSFTSSLKKSNRHQLIGVTGSSLSLLLTHIKKRINQTQILVLQDERTATCLYSDLAFLCEKKTFFFPRSIQNLSDLDKTDNAKIVFRTEVLNQIKKNNSSLIITYPEAVFEKVLTRIELTRKTIKIKQGDSLVISSFVDELEKFQFARVDFVKEPGDYAVRGGIVDVFSYSNNYAFRIELFGNKVESIRSFNTESQQSIINYNKILIIPNIEKKVVQSKRVSLFEFLPKNSIIWCDEIELHVKRLNSLFKTTQKNVSKNIIRLKNLFINGSIFLEEIKQKKVVEISSSNYFKKAEKFNLNTIPQPSFNKQFRLLSVDLKKRNKDGFKNILFCSSPKQVERLFRIFRDITKEIEFTPIVLPLHQGFIDKDRKLVCYTDHQIFERYNKIRLRKGFKKKQAITLKEFNTLKIGDYVTHIDHGVGSFDGLKKIDVQGKLQEAIKLTYFNNDILYISIHSLHKITKFRSKDGTTPKLSKLGTNHWKNLKKKTKTKVKKLAFDLVKLYAERKKRKGFEFSPDTYLQHELEASFIYEDTPDQFSSTREVKADMESKYPMDRLVCGDVGFGKTEVAIRAAFKAVADSKQVAILVPTTILAFQHFKTFSSRLEGLPCRIDYINRFKSKSDQKKTIKELKNGKIDILIGTHRLISSDIKFRDIGLLVIDEEQKFGVGVKDKLKLFKANIDTLTLTATPIPRTLQFSLMGARDFSIIRTAPPNRYPIQTTVYTFNEEIIKDAIMYEISRGGQVFFINNRIDNIKEIADLISRLCPDVSVGIGHGQMKGAEVEKLMIDFIEGKIDVLVATSIIESGLDIPNANTIIINRANMFGLSDLHQMRGRVGRSNKKAFCYLLTPTRDIMSADAKKRLQTLEQFTDLGSGFNIAMKDLEIRGAGDLLGPEQSGFINEIGFDAYQNILTEAVEELKEEELKKYFSDQKELDVVKECLIDVDLEILIPDLYINNTAQRFATYKELNDIDNEEALTLFEYSLIDRFGPIPDQVLDLFKLVRVKWAGKLIGFEKLILKSRTLIGYFVKNQESLYYKSNQFGYILDFVKSNPKKCRMKEKNNLLSIIFRGVNNADEMLHILKQLRNNV